jgi:hypothetical protein
MRTLSGDTGRPSLRARLLHAAFFVLVPLGFSCSSPAGEAPAEWSTLEPKLRAPDLVDRFVEASRLLIGIPYAGGPLGEGDVGGPDPDPRVDLSRADCVTYLEESLALALSARRTESDFLRILDAIRYENGRTARSASSRATTSPCATGCRRTLGSSTT